ncbi:hypothetical protein SAMN04515647_2681 [Cohaesibacter sp. ES.047]|nr:hypothetical protein SAMN04515647_2681 [Cohaesibacter sp. ES.047]
MTIQLQAIYRYPVKGFSPQRLDAADVTAGKPLPWDRAFAIENGPSGFDGTAPVHLGKIHFLMLMRQPELAALRTDFDPQTGALCVVLADKMKAEGNLFEEGGMEAVFAYLKTYLAKPMRGEPKLLHASGHAFTDAKTQDISLINLASVRAISEKAGEELDPIRFRGNFYVDGARGWQEHDWVGKEITIGDVSFMVRKRTQRCAATNANPVTGERDQQIPKLLMSHFEHMDCGIHLMPLGSGEVKPGDALCF